MESKLQPQEAQRARTERPNLTGIPAQMKLDFEQRSGLSFDDVRVHYNSERPAGFQADAYTYGTDVYIAPGQKAALRHELGHVIQQKMGISHHDTVENGVPVSDAPGIEKQADEFGRNLLPRTWSAPGRWPKKIAPVVMKSRHYKKVLLPRMAPFIAALRAPDWELGPRRRTAYGVSNGIRRQGPHIYPFVMWEVFVRALTKAGGDLDRLCGTRLIPYPKTAARMMGKIARSAVRRRLVGSSLAKLRVKKYKQLYSRYYRRQNWRALIELNPFHTYGLFKLAGHQELQGNGERRGAAVDDLLSTTGELSRDIQGETPYVDYKSRRQGAALRRIAQQDGTEENLSMDSEYESGDSSDSDITEDMVSLMDEEDSEDTGYLMDEEDPVAADDL